MEMLSFFLLTEFRLLHLLHHGPYAKKRKTTVKLKQFMHAVQLEMTESRF